MPATSITDPVALFFLRHYNDVDHITPVIDAWSRRGHRCDVILSGTSTFAGDYRVQHLRALHNVRVAHIRELVPAGTLRRVRLLSLLLHPDAARYPLAASLLRLIGMGDEPSRNRFWTRMSSALLDRTFGASGVPGVVAFDWISTRSMLPLNFVEAVVAQARARGLGTVSLPHGDSPHISLMIRDGEYDLRESPKFGAARIFDAVVVPNELCARRYRPYLKPEQIRVLGSARYCPEWLGQLAQLLPLPELPRQPGMTRVVMFLRKAPFSLFWTEIEQVIRLLSSMGDIDLIVKWHTRRGLSNPLRRISRPGKEPPRVRFVGDEVHSRQLMAWADIIIDLATSVVYEAVRQNKPVLAAEYLQAGRSALAHYLPETELRCRDDVYLKVRALQRAGRGAFYDPARRERFIADMLDGGGPDVLGRYVDLLESLARPDRAAAPAAAAPLTLAEHA